jgi:hypothetical protein
MSFNGGQDNKAFRSGMVPEQPYYYISGHLYLTGLHTGQVVETDPYIFYFNRDNNFSYLDRRLYPSPDDYAKFYTIDDNSVIGEVTVYANPSIIYEGDIADLNFEVGGVYKPSIALDQSINPADLATAQSMDVWGGPTGNVPGPITVDQLENAQVCYYGREPADPQPNPENVDNLEFGSRRYLAVRFVPIDNAAKDLSNVGPRKSARPIPKIYRHKMVPKNRFQPLKQGVVNRQVRVIYEPLVEVGTIHVVVKVFPKAIF